jgi:histidinol dehydrogenase
MKKAEINQYVLSGLPPDARAALLRRAQAHLDGIMPMVQQIVAAVRERGDEALIGYAATYDGAEICPGEIQVTDDEFSAAEEAVAPALRYALEQAVQNIRRHHERQLPPPTWMEELSPGAISGERYTPIASVGLYVPRGKGSFPSVMIMLGVPAVLAGVPTISVCTPPGGDGAIDAATLVAARLCGIDRVYKVGGAPAIAALAYGTQTIDRVEKIIGPGNRWVAAARRLVYGDVNPGAPAGPSESIVLCDEHADPEVAARELLVEAEHGPDSAALLVTTSVEFADAVADKVISLAEELPERRRENCDKVLCKPDSDDEGYGGIVVAQSVEDAVAFVNDYAPEHLRLLVQRPFELLGRIKNAGEVLLGEYTSIPFGNFAIGVNAILPTGGTARSYSCTGVHDFLKRSSFAYVSAEGAARLGPIATELARYEGFPAHANAAAFAQQRAEDALGRLVQDTR